MTREEEREIVIRAQAGDADAINAIFKAHERALWKMAITTISRSETRDDLFAAAVQFFFESLSRFNPNYGTRVSTFTYQFVKNKLFAHAMNSGLIHIPVGGTTTDPKRAGLAMRPASRVVADKSEVAREDRGPRDIDDADEFEHILAAIQRLRPRERAVINLLLDGHGIPAIAEQWGLSRSRIHQLYQSALNHLRWLLNVKPSELTASNKRGTMLRRKRKCKTK